MKILGRLSTRAALLVLVGVAALAGAAYSAPTARLSLVNAGLTIEYGTQPGVFLLSCAAAFALVALLARHTSVRVLAAGLALTAALLGVDSLRFSATAERDVLRVRRLVGTRTLAWTQVAKVESEPTAAVFVELSGARWRLDLTGLRPEQRAGFDRAVARRIWESGRDLTPP